MIWVTWRQFRATIAAGVLIPLAIALVTAAISIAIGGRFHGFYFYSCFGYSSSRCLAESALTLATLATIALPVVLGVFVGVTTFSRDIERGTHVLGLTQAVSRRRWYWTRLLVVFVPVVLAMLVLGLVSYWARFRSFSGVFAFAGTIDSRIAFPTFGAVGIVPAGYTVLGLAIGSTSALLLRHTIGAMILTLIAMVAALALFPAQIREHYATPDREYMALEDRFGYGGSSDYTTDPFYPKWFVGSDFVDTNGNRVTVDFDTCVPSRNYWSDPDPEETTVEYNARMDALMMEDIRERVECLRGMGVDHFENRYHDDRLFWRFQLIESALFVLLSAVFAGGSTLLIRRLRP